MKKGLAILLILLLVISSLAACSKDDPSAPADDPAAPAGASADEQDGAASDAETADDEKGEDEGKDDEDKSEKTEQADEAGQESDQKKPDGEKKPASSSAKPSGGSSGTSTSGGSGSSTSSKPKDEDEDEDKAPSGTPSEMIEKIYAKQPVDLWLGTTVVDLSNAELLLSATGLSSSAKIKAAAYSESMMGAQPYSLVVVRVKDSKNTEAVAKAMLDGIDPAKWVCVEADDVRVAAYDDLIMLCMVSTEYADTVTAKEMVKAFKKVCGGKLDVSLKR